MKERELQEKHSSIENKFTGLKNYAFLSKYIGKKVYKFHVESGYHSDFNYELYSDTTSPDVSQLSAYDKININFEIVLFEVDCILDNCHYFDGVFINNLVGIF